MTALGIKRIVVGVDGSEHAGSALDWAVLVAKAMDSEVIAVYALDIPVWAADPFTTAQPPQFDPEWRTEIRQAFEERWCKPLRDAGVRYRSVMEDGRPATVIDSVADAEGADLVVLGRRGRGEVAELVLGSISHEVVLASKRPVLLIPRPKAGPD